MDILAPLPETHAGRHTQWLWSRMLAIAGGSPPPDPEELAQHFAPSAFEQVSAEQLIAHLAHLAPVMPLVTQLVEEECSGQRYSVLLGLPNGWLRYSCLAQDDEPHLLLAAAYSQALEPNSYSDQRVQRDGRDVQIRDFGVPVRSCSCGMVPEATVPTGKLWSRISLASTSSLRICQCTVGPR